ncbi:hypothetical protein [Arthrobacter globiformis]|uniref:hypothetical protein n=1 Tax=Arthrobacter globiformis TaxID=1665 RepID=UPI001112522C|nr:hypothetical protein [Arthrobacter globiformis]
MAIFAVPGAAVAAEDLVPVPETGTPGLLSLSSSVYPLTLPVLEPAESFSWQIGLKVTEPLATATLQVSAAGEIAATDRYLVSVEECAEPWQGTSGLNGSLGCPSGSISRIAPTSLVALRQDVQVPLSDLRAGTEPYLGFSLSRPAGTVDSGGTSLTLGIGVSAMGEGTGGASIPDPDPSQDPGQSQGPDQPTEPGQSPMPDHSRPPGQPGDATRPVATDTNRSDTSQEAAGWGDTGLGDTGAALLPALFAGGALVLLGTAVVVTLRRPRTSPKIKP